MAQIGKFHWKLGCFGKNEIPQLIGERQNLATTACSAQGFFSKIITPGYSPNGIPQFLRQNPPFGELFPPVHNSIGENSASGHALQTLLRRRHPDVAGVRGATARCARGGGAKTAWRCACRRSPRHVRICGSRSQRRVRFWTAPAERSGDGAFGRARGYRIEGNFPCVRKAVSRCACHRSPRRNRFATRQ